MPPQNPALRHLHSLANLCPPLMGAYRKTKVWAQRDMLANAVFRKVFDRGRLTLPEIEAEKVSPAAEAILLPVLYPLFAGEDAPLNDVLFLMNAAKGRQAKRILEVGTYRARTTYGLHTNCPDATLVSYDIQVIDCEYRRRLQAAPNVELRLGSFAAAAETLRTEPRYDLIFVDGSHQVGAVVEDSRLALEIVAPGGLIIWHDYRPNDYFTAELRVPEGLQVIARDHKVFAVPGTMCAVYFQPA
jgi:predicted O-methyltransferase YrrM